MLRNLFTKSNKKFLVDKTSKKELQNIYGIFAQRLEKFAQNCSYKICRFWLIIIFYYNWNLYAYNKHLFVIPNKFTIYILVRIHQTFFIHLFDLIINIHSHVQSTNYINSYFNQQTSLYGWDTKMAMEC